MSETTVEKTFCSTREAADLLGVSVGTVKIWVETGLLQAWKTAGGHRRVMRDSVDRLLRKPPDAGAPGEPPAPAGPRKMAIMVVEDDPDLLRLYGLHIQHWPMPNELTCLDNAFAALMELGRRSPDLLILDLHMPGMDGFELLRSLPKAPGLAHTQVVVVTGMDAAGILERGGLPDSVEVLRKPVPFDRLRSIAVGIANQARFQLQVA